MDYLKHVDVAASLQETQRHQLLLMHLIKQQLMFQQQQQQQDDMTAAQMLMSLSSLAGGVCPIGIDSALSNSPAQSPSPLSPSTQAAKILKPHPKFRAKVKSSYLLTFFDCSNINQYFLFTKE